MLFFYEKFFHEIFVDPFPPILFTGGFFGQRKVNQPFYQFSVSLIILPFYSESIHDISEILLRLNNKRKPARLHINKV